jgi:hypothetical protein
MAETQHDAEIISADRQKQAQLMQEKLEAMGIKVRIIHYPGDSSLPTEYTLMHGEFYGVGPTMDLAAADFIESLLIALKKARR